MNYHFIARILAKFCTYFGVVFLPCLVCALVYKEYAAVPFWLGLGSGVSLGGAAAQRVLVPGSKKTFHREALLLVVIAWLICGVVGAVPFVWMGSMRLVPALFESFSGFTTCGASVLDDVESLPRSLLFWRSFTHWLGGIGIIVLFLVIMPSLGVKGKMLLAFESTRAPGALSLQKRLRASVFTLLTIYLVLTVLETGALMATGAMGLFDALCHTFGTLATGGYSTKQASIGHYNSVAVEGVVIVFMVAGATSFALHDKLFRGRFRTAFSDPEWTIFLGLLVLAIVLCSLNIYGVFGWRDLDPAAEGYTPVTFKHALRAAAFNVTSLFTNTGFATDDFDRWPYFSRMLIVFLMFLGGCAGSTTGGVKIARVIVLAKILFSRLERLFRPHLVRVIRMRGEEIPEQAVVDATTFFVAYVLTYALGCLAMAAWGLPFASAASAVAAAMTCTGPGIELIGATETYSIVPDGGLLTLIVLMVTGRLEFMAVFALLVPRFWVSN